MKTEGTLIYHKITVATGLVQNNAYGHELVVLCLIIPCVHILFMFYLYKKCKWLSCFAIDAIDRAINRSDCIHLTQKRLLLGLVIRSPQCTVV